MSNARTRSRLVVGALALALGFPASVQAATQTIEGQASPSPRMLSIFVSDTGSLQARRGVPFVGQPGQTQAESGMFFPAGLAGPAANFWHLRVKGAPADNVTFGPRDAPVTSVSNGPVLGDWSAASPARVSTVMRIQHTGADLFEVTQTTLYVAAELRFRVVWDIRNPSTQTIPFVFGTSADLFIESDAGEGVLLAGPPRFLGGRNKFTATVGGVEEALSSQLPGEASPTVVPPWASYEEGDPFPVTRRLSSQDGFLNTINPLFMDNGVGVSFNDRATSGHRRAFRTAGRVRRAAERGRRRAAAARRQQRRACRLRWCRARRRRCRRHHGAGHPRSARASARGARRDPLSPGAPRPSRSGSARRRTSCCGSCAERPGAA